MSDERIMRLTFSGLRLTKGGARDTARHTWELIGRTCAPQVLLLETYGGYQKGYLKCFDTEQDAHLYIRRRCAKKGYIEPGQQPDGCNIVEYGTTQGDEKFFLTDQSYVGSSLAPSQPPDESGTWNSKRIVWAEIRKQVVKKAPSTVKREQFEFSVQQLAEALLDRIAVDVHASTIKRQEAIREINNFIQPEGMGGALMEPLRSCLTAWADVEGVTEQIVARKPIEAPEPEPQYQQWGAWS